MGAAQRGGEARWDGSSRSRVDDLLLDIGSEVPQGGGVLGGVVPELPELHLGLGQLVLELAEAVWSRRRGWWCILCRLGSPPHPVGHAAMSPPSCLRSRGRGEGDEGDRRVRARLSNKESPS